MRDQTARVVDDRLDVLTLQRVVSSRCDGPMRLGKPPRNRPSEPVKHSVSHYSAVSANTSVAIW